MFLYGEHKDDADWDKWWMTMEIDGTRWGMCMRMNWWDGVKNSFIKMVFHKKFGLFRDVARVTVK